MFCRAALGLGDMMHEQYRDMSRRYAGRYAGVLSAWVPHARPRGAPRLTYGRSVAKAMDVFNLDHARWPELAADRARWRAMLQSGEAPP